MRASNGLGMSMSAGAVAISLITQTSRSTRKARRIAGGPCLGLRRSPERTLRIATTSVLNWGLTRRNAGRWHRLFSGWIAVLVLMRTYRRAPANFTCNLTIRNIHAQFPLSLRFPPFDEIIQAFEPFPTLFSYSSRQLPLSSSGQEGHLAIRSQHRGEQENSLFARCSSSSFFRMTCVPF